jgi:hypothetical protein
MTSSFDRFEDFHLSEKSIIAEELIGWWPLKFDEMRDMVVRRLIEQGVLRTPRVIRAMRLVKREEFVPPDLKDHAYVDSPLPIGYNQTISAPHG